MTKTNVIIYLIVIIYNMGLCQKTLLTQRSRTLMREGPACYYPIVAELMRSTPVVLLDTNNKWLNISVQDKTGWVAKYALKAPTENTPFMLDPFSDATTLVSPASVSAAIKGFSQNFIATRLDKTFDKDLYSYVDMNIMDYAVFIKDTYLDRNPRKIRKRKKITRSSSVMDYSINLEKIGYSVALGLSSSMTLIHEPYESYLNNVATLIGSNSQWYDVQFRVLLLDESIPTAYATPGGIIFVTKGLIDSIENEAELAVLIGHEIAHVIFGHGYQELQERQEMILAEESLYELELETGELASDIEQELSALALTIYNYLVKNRLDEYEEQADQWGLIYAYRAGYDPYALLSVLHRVQEKKPSGKEDHTKGHWWSVSIENRIQIAKNFIERELFKKHDDNRSFAHRYYSTIDQ